MCIPNPTIRYILELYRDELGDRDLDIAAFIVSQCMESLTHGAVMHRPDLLGGDDKARTVAEKITPWTGIKWWKGTHHRPRLSRT